MQIENAATDNRSLFRVALVCEAAPHIGCAPIARPLLTELERQPAVQEVRLNREGTILGVLWKSASPDPQIIIDAMARYGLAGTQLDGSELRLACAAFAAGDGWYRAMQLQELSAEEAGVIAARMVRRLKQRTDLPADTVERLMQRLEQRCAIALHEGGAAALGIERLREQVAAALLDAGRDVLDPGAYSALAAVVALGHRPLPEEQ